MSTFFNTAANDGVQKVSLALTQETRDLANMMETLLNNVKQTLDPNNMMDAKK